MPPPSRDLVLGYSEIAIRPRLLFMTATVCIAGLVRVRVSGAYRFRCGMRQDDEVVTGLYSVHTPFPERWCGVQHHTRQPLSYPPGRCNNTRHPQFVA